MKDLNLFHDNAIPENLNPIKEIESYFTEYETHCKRQNPIKEIESDEVIDFLGKYGFRLNPIKEIESRAF